MKWQPGKTLSWVFEGQKVFAPCRFDGARYLMICEVVKACGTTALAENKKRDWRRWFDVNDLREVLETSESSNP